MDPEILVGKPVIRGMRVSVAQIIQAVAAGLPRRSSSRSTRGWGLKTVRQR
jgi:uncharacterized protein (DUF433 family)